jgi:hypothetical protein
VLTILGNGFCRKTRNKGWISHGYTASGTRSSKYLKMSQTTANIDEYIWVHDRKPMIDNCRPRHAEPYGAWNRETCESNRETLVGVRLQYRGGKDGRGTIFQSLTR